MTNERTRIVSLKMPKVMLTILDDLIAQGYFTNRTDAIKQLIVIGLLELENYIGHKPTKQDESI